MNLASGKGPEYIENVEHRAHSTTQTGRPGMATAAGLLAPLWQLGLAKVVEISNCAG
jgi:hypothetical protein